MVMTGQVYKRGDNELRVIRVERNRNRALCQISNGCRVSVPVEELLQYTLIEQPAIYP